MGYHLRSKCGTTSVEQKRRYEITIAGNDAGCADTLINHDGWRLTLPKHNETPKDSAK